MNFDSDAIARATGGRVVTPAAWGPIATDTRALQEGAWFLALVGDRFDGHAFLDRAAQAAGCIVSRPVDFKGGQVLVADTTRALQDLGRAARDRLSGPVIGLTGSSGKTTTRSLLALALSPLGLVHQTVGNLNNHLGVPMSLCAAPEQAAASVIEMGTSAPGEIAVLADIARPDVRLLINVGPAHLQELGGLDGVAREKGALVASARPGDLVVLNADDERIMALPRPPGARIVTYGRDGEFALLDAHLDGESLHTIARVATPEGVVGLDLPTPGLHIAHNAAGALAVAVMLGVDARAAAAAMADYEPVGMRLRKESLPGGIVVLNDAYNANPQSTLASVRTLATLPGRRVAVLGDMLELGADEARLHREVLLACRDLDLDLVLAVGPRMAAAAPDAMNFWAAEQGETLVERLADWLAPGDRVLFKGSRGARVEQVLQALRDLYDRSNS